MPSKFDQDLIKNLENFTESLEGVVELMRQQAEKGGDAANKAMSAIDSERIELIVSDMKTLIKSNEDIKNTQQKILEEIKASKKQKETGMFEKIEGKENKSKIKDGIQTVILIAGGVLAIGLAFKLIGSVDYLSVVSLSMGMLIVSLAFGEIAKIKELTPGKALLVGFALITIAGALTISSVILQSFKTVNQDKLLSFVVVSSALGVGAYFIFKAVENLKMKANDIWKYLLLPIILPAIALGITLASKFLTDIKPISYNQGLSAIFVGAALAVGALSIALIIKALDKNMNPITLGLAVLAIPAIAWGMVKASEFFKNMENIGIAQGLSAIFVGAALIVGAFAVALIIKALGNNMNPVTLGLAVLAIPILAWGMVLASQAFQNFEELKMDPKKLMLGSLAMGVAIVAFLPAVYVLGKMNLKDMLTGVLGVILVAGAVVIASYVLNQGIYDGKYPNYMWSLNVGLSLVMFTIPIFFLGYVKLDKLLMGALGVIVVSAAIAATSWIISLGKYDGAYPNIKWALGVGLSLLMFTPAILVLGLIAMTGVGALAILAGAALTLLISATIVKVADILNEGTYKAYPPLDWALGVGLSMITFGAAMIIIGVGAVAILLGALMTFVVAGTIVTVAKMLDKTKYGEYPPTKWTLGIGLTLVTFGSAMIVLGIIAATGIGAVALVLGAVFTLVVALTITKVADILDKGKYGAYPPLGWTVGVGLSLIPFGSAMIVLGVIAATGIGAVALVLGAVFTLVVAGTIVAVSYILNKGDYTSFPPLKWAAGVGLSLTAFGTGMMMLGAIAMTGLGLIAILAGAGLTLVVAAAIVGVSKILSNGTYDTHPSLDWAAGAGLSLVAFGTGMIMLGLIPFAGLILNKGLERVLFVATGIKLASEILAGGNYKGGPTKEWAEGVGLALSAFAYALSVSTETSLFSKKIDTNAFGNFMVSIAESMIKVADVLRTGKWDGAYPSKEWGEGVATSLTPFVNAYEAISQRKSLFKSANNDSFGELMLSIASAMVRVSDILSKGSWVGGPSQEWSAGIGETLMSFAKISQDSKMKDIKKNNNILPDIAESMVKVADILSKGNFSGGPETDWVTKISNLFDVVVNKVPDKNQLRKLQDFIAVLKDFSLAAEKIKDSGIEKLNKLTTSVTIMSVIDDQRLQSVIRVLDNNKENLSNIIEAKGGTQVETRKQVSTEVERTEIGTGTSSVSDKQDMMLDKFDKIIGQFDELLEYTLQDKVGENTGKMDSTK